MATCILWGHEFDPHPGAGQFKGQSFAVCRNCGKTIPLGELPAQKGPSLPNAFQRLEALRSAND